MYYNFDQEINDMFVNTVCKRQTATYQLCDAIVIAIAKRNCIIEFSH